MLQDISLLVDSYTETKEARLKLERAAAGLKEKEEQYKADIIKLLREHNEFTAQGRVSYYLKTGTKIAATDWPALHEYIRAHDAFDMLHKRLTESAIKLRLEDGILVPGIEILPTFDLTVAKYKEQPDQQEPLK